METIFLVKTLISFSNSIEDPFKNDVTVKMPSCRPSSPYVTVSHFFHYTPSSKSERASHMTKGQEDLVELKIHEMLGKGTIRPVPQVKDRFVGNMFKKDGSRRPVINLKNLNEYVLYHHFNNESLHSLKHIMK